MKTNPALATCRAQGALTPTMKSLAQIEPRTPISFAPYFILTPGSYYLTTNLTVSSGGAIAIATNNVTLDLNGFTISSTASPAAGTAILLTGSGSRVNVSIYNGHSSSSATNTVAGVFGGSGFGDGIYYLVATPPINVRVKDVLVAGVLNNGIVLNTGNATVVESCTVNVAGYQGIIAGNVANSTALYCGNLGIYAETAQNCKSHAVGGGTGVGISATTASNCVGYNSSNGTGLSAFIANPCRGSAPLGTALAVTHNLNSF